MDKPLQKIIDIVHSLHEQPTMNLGVGKIAGTTEAGDDPPAKPKKRYIYQKGVRKLWSPNGRRN